MSNDHQSNDHQSNDQLLHSLVEHLRQRLAPQFAPLGYQFQNWCDRPGRHVLALIPPGQHHQHHHLLVSLQSDQLQLQLGFTSCGCDSYTPTVFATLVSPDHRRLELAHPRFPAQLAQALDWVSCCILTGYTAAVQHDPLATGVINVSPGC